MSYLGGVCRPADADFQMAAKTWQAYAGFAVRDEAQAVEVLGAAVAAMHARADSAALRPVLIVEDEMQRCHPNVGRGVPEPLPSADGDG